jgi:hypothetical protein
MSAASSGEEEQRLIHHDSCLLRNKAYWQQLKDIQRSGELDAAKLVSYLIKKSQFYEKLADVISSDDATQIPVEDAKFSAVSNVQNEIFRDVGGTAVKAMSDLDGSWSRKYIDFSMCIKSSILSSFQSQLQILDKDLVCIWTRGENLFFALDLTNKRVVKYWQEVSLTSNRKTAHEHDAWISQMKYNVAIARYYQLFDECNKQFKQLFELSKDLETRRIAVVLKTAGTAIVFVTTTWG